MAQAKSLATLGMFAAVIPLLGVCVGVAGGDAAVQSPKPEKEVIARWLDRAQRYAAVLPESQLIDVLPTLADVMVAADEEGQIDRLLATIKEPKKRADQGLVICMALAAQGRFDAAIRRAQLLPRERRKSEFGELTNSWRTGALFTVAILQSSGYDFAGAKETIKLLDDPRAVSDTSRRLAENQAKAGRYAEAEESLKRFVATTENEKSVKEDARKLIIRYKAEGRKDPPMNRSGTYLERLRRACTIFGDTGTKLDNLAGVEKAEKAAETAKGAVNKATAWREIAWAYYDMRGTDKKNLERARVAIGKSVQNAETIPRGLGQSYPRAMAFTSAADLYLELGDIEAATQIAKRADAVRLDDDMLGGLNAFTTTPMLIAVLVRVGDNDGAIAIIERMQKAADKKADAVFSPNPDAAWSAWATVCTVEGRTARVERQLEKVGSARIKAILCAGVAAGLLELQHKPAGTWAGRGIPAP
jgi:tetratricopeptide (TPR) repeat protein